MGLCNRAGFLVSNQNRRLLFNEDGTPTARSNKILSGTPTGRFVESEELLGGVFFNLIFSPPYPSQIPVSVTMFPENSI